ncbi:MAG: PP2C family protein-serine/threonine phosphatase [Bacilli bacterium]
MEKILIGVKDKDQIVLVVYKNESFIIDPNNLAKEFNKIEEKYPGFEQEYFKPNSTRLIPEKELDNYLEKINTPEKNIQNLEQKINEKIKASNTKIYERVINRCKEDIILGKQIKLMHSEYSLGNTMYAVQDVGKRRNNQEDSVLILEHPLNNDFKLLAVSDGVGGNAGGELASSHIVAKLTNWFENLNPNLYNNIDQVQTSLDDMLPHILKDLEAPNEASATLSAVIIGKDKTLITNIGDSRVYSMKNQKIIQETIDDSLVQKMFETKTIPNKELMRFNKRSNIITNSIKKSQEAIEPSYSIIENTSYDRIIAVSDGVTDCISEKELENLMKTKNKEKMTSDIVNYAILNDSYLNETLDDLPKKEKRQAVKAIKNNPDIYMNKINGGKDNTTIAAYIKK